MEADNILICRLPDAWQGYCTTRYQIAMSDGVEEVFGRKVKNHFVCRSLSTRQKKPASIENENMGVLGEVLLNGNMVKWPTFCRFERSVFLLLTKMDLSKYHFG